MIGEKSSNRRLSLILDDDPELTYIKSPGWLANVFRSWLKSSSFFSIDIYTTLIFQWHLQNSRGGSKNGS